MSSSLAFLEYEKNTKMMLESQRSGSLDFPIDSRPILRRSILGIDMEHEGNKLLFRDEVFQLQGAIFEVSRQMAIGFLEPVYHECLARELKTRTIPYEREKTIELHYKGECLAQTYRLDFVCFGKIILELKCVSGFRAEHHAQILNYLRATDCRLGLMVNFGKFPKAEVKRIAL